MTKYNSFNVKLSNSQLNEIKSIIKNKSEVVLRLSSNMIDNSDATYFSHKSLLTNRQVPNLCKVFANQLSADTKLAKNQLSKMIQSGEFLARLLCPLLKTGLPLIKSVIKPVAKSVLIPLGLTPAASAVDTVTHKKILGLGTNTTTPIISDIEREEIIKIVKSLEDPDLLLKGVTETIQNEVKKTKRRTSQYVIRYIRCKFIRKYFIWQRSDSNES